MGSTRLGLGLVVALATAGVAGAQSYTWFTNPSNGHRYALTSPMTWHQAEAEAQRAGGHLATVRSSGENDWLFQTFRGSIEQGVRLWIGFTDEAEEGTWVWSSSEPFTFTAWASGQPDDVGGQDHAYLWETPFGTWADEQGANPHPGIIEVRTRATYTTFGTGCPGTNGTPTLTPATGSLPVTGGELVVELGSLPPSILNVPFGILGISNTTNGNMDLPFDLSVIGMTACLLYVSTNDVMALTNVGGTATWTLAIPDDAGLIGARFFQQAFVLDGGANPLGGTMTNAGEGTIGPG